MENINLKLLTNKKQVLEGESKLRILDNKYYFKIDDSNYVLDIALKSLLKKNIDSVVQIDILNKKMSISLLNTPGKIDVVFIDCSMDINDNNIIIKYKYDLDGITEQEIDINLY